MLKHEIYLILCVSVIYLVLNTQLLFRAELHEETTLKHHGKLKENGNEKLKENGNEKLKENGNGKLKENRNDSLKEKGNVNLKEKGFKYILYWNEAYDSKGNLIGKG